MALKYTFLDLKPVNEPFEVHLKNAACNVISSGRYINGEQVERLEQEVARMSGVEHAVAVSNGLDALRLIVRAYKEKGVFCDGDEIIMSANTYIATALAVSSEGLKPVFVDMSLMTLDLDTSLIESAITSRTVAVMPVHLYGTPCWDATLMKVARTYNLKIIEDNAQAIGAEASIPGLNGTRCTGGLGNAAGISFYPTKNLGALGDAGMVTTSDKELAEVVRALANYGCDRRYHNLYQGYNCRMDELQAAMLLVKLPYLQAENARRRELVTVYDSAIYSDKLVKPHIFDDMRQVWHQYPLQVKERSRFIDYMTSKGIGTDVIYPAPCYAQPCYVEEYVDVCCPKSEVFAEEVVCLPVGAHISLEDARYIAAVVSDFA